MTAPARIAAFEALRAIASARADLPSALARSREQLGDERDRRLAADIVAGTLRRQRALDFLAAHFAKRPLDRIDGDVLVILELSLYQILSLDRVPAAAVVDDAVDLTRRARKSSASGFVNAVLRSTLRHRHQLPLPPRPDPADRDAALAYLGITHSHPDWLVARWLDRHGFEAAEQWVTFDNEAPSLTLRVNTLRASRDEVRRRLDDEDVLTEPARYAPDGLIVTSGNPLQRPLDGLFFIQDEASQIVAEVVDARPGDRVLDLCASPGGKSTALAARMRDTGFIAACDVRPRRVALLRDTVRASGARHIGIVHVGTEGQLPFTPTFDRILVDAPCSGLGTIRRDPDIKWRRRESELAVLAREQVALLRRAADVLTPGGRLVYATCSSEPEENEEVVARFLAERPDFQLIDLRREGAPVASELIDERGMLRTLPFAHGLEAFFAAVFRLPG
jgi:16S rRNA (cytosine967-C5)-methyltransferase